MEAKKYLFKVGGLALISLLFFLHIKYNSNTVVGWILLGVYFSLVGADLRALLTQVFKIDLPKWALLLLASFLSLGLIGYTSSIFIIFYTLSPFIISAIFFIVGLFCILLRFFLLQDKPSNRSFFTGISHLKNIICHSEQSHSVVEESLKVSYLVTCFKGFLRSLPKLGRNDNIHLKPKSYSILIVLYILLVTTGFYLLYTSRTDVGFYNPWEIIHPFYLVIFLSATTLLGFLIIYSKSLSHVLLLIIIHSVLLHSYLPLVHKLVYGPDQWRHMANEMLLLKEEPIRKVEIKEEGISQIQSLNLGLLSYSHLWGIKVILVRVTHTDLITMTAWLLPIAWSIILPLLLYGIGTVLFTHQKRALFFAWLGFLPFTWQFAGSVTLPISWGFLLWLLFVFLLLKYSENPDRKKWTILLLLWLSSFWGYILYPIIGLISWLVVSLLKYVQTHYSDFFSSQYKKYSVLTILSLCVACSIPALELISKYSSFDHHLRIFQQLKQILGNFTALYIAAGPRSHYILTGNIIFNQPPLYRFVETFITYNRWWLVIFMMGFLSISGIGIGKLLKNNSPSHRWIGIMSLGLGGNYILGRYLLGGEQILSRRLDTLLAFFIMSTFFAGVIFIFEKFFKNKWKKIIIIAGIIIISLGTTAAYSLGPANESVSINNYRAMEYVWSEEKNISESQHCVLADVYPLLALETISAKQVVGGGFPINQYFAQPERERLFKELTQNAQLGSWYEALRLTKVSHCWLVVKKQDLQYNDLVREHQHYIKVFGDILVWKYTK